MGGLVTHAARATRRMGKQEINAYHIGNLMGRQEINITYCILNIYKVQQTPTEIEEVHSSLSLLYKHKTITKGPL